MQTTPKADRLHIAIFGKRNAGKSSLFNTLINQDISIVSDFAGTTTDPVEKSMEFLPLGPVVFIDTAGVDDEGHLGLQRINKTKKVLDRTDIAIIISDYTGWNEYEVDIYNELKSREIPVLAIVNKQDIEEITESKLQSIKQYVKNPLQISLINTNDVVNKIKEQLISICPEEFITPPSILDGLIKAQDTIVVVVPIDKEAPKGRLILPQVQVIRDILDNKCKAFITQVEELDQTLSELNKKPNLIITDSQVFKDVVKIIPDDLPLTSFSILFARLKGDLQDFYEGAKHIDNLKDGSKILICESCSHHQIEDDIARVKIPNLLKSKTKKNLIFDYKSGHDFIDNLQEYDLLIHCGACMTNRKEVLSRIIKCKKANLPITNYGMAIAHCLGILQRALAPFKIMDIGE